MILPGRPTQPINILQDKVPNGPLLHFIYKENAESEAGWQATADTSVMVYSFMAKTLGPYPYPVYSFLQGSGGVRNILWLQ
jgi:hypothetical protein